MLNQKEAILGALVTDELQRVNKSLSMWGKDIELPAETSWKNKESLTLGEFLAMHPAPSDLKNRSEVLFYGIAWELTVGKIPPKIITDERDKLLTKNRFELEEISYLEQIWLNLIAADIDLF